MAKNSVALILLVATLLLFVTTVSPTRRSQRRKQNNVLMMNVLDVPTTYHFENCPDSLNSKINAIAASCDPTFEIVKIVRILASSGDDLSNPGAPLNPSSTCTVQGAVCACNPDVRRTVTCEGQLVQAINVTTADGCPIQQCACVAGASLSDGACICADESTQYDAATNSCKNRCDDSALWQDGQCVPKCEPTQIYNYETRECERDCGEGKKWDAATQTCVSKCNFDQTWDSDKKQCVNICPKGQAYDRLMEKCYSICKPEEYYDTVEDRCVVTPSCGFGQRFDVNERKCVSICKLDEAYDKVENKCYPLCRPEESYDQVTDCCVARCPTSQVWSIPHQACQEKCEPGTEWRDGACVSLCLVGEIWVDGKCTCNEQSGPVCATNGKTYVSKCALQRAQATLSHVGACNPDEQTCEDPQQPDDQKCLTKCPQCKDTAYSLKQQFTQQGCADECLCINKERKCVTQDVQVDVTSSQTVMSRVCCTKIKSYDSVTSEEFKPVKACSQTKCATSKIAVNVALQALFL